MGGDGIDEVAVAERGGAAARGNADETTLDTT